MIALQYKAQMRGGGCNHFITAPEPTDEACELMAFLVGLGIEEANDPAWVRERFHDLILADLH